MATGSMALPRGDHTATLLPDGRVLAAAGYWSSNGTTNAAETYDPATGVWTATGHLNKVRDMHTATLLPDGKVLVAGGEIYDANPLSTAEIYDPATGIWSLTGELVVGALWPYSNAASQWECAHRGRIG